MKQPKLRAAPVLKVILVNLMVLFALLALFELSARLFVKNLRTQGTDYTLFDADVYGHSTGLSKQAMGKSFGKTASTDNYRFRQTGNKKKTKTNSKLYIGDSVTFGVGMEDNQTFTSLHESLGDQNIYNPSVLGWTIVDYGNALQDVLAYPEFQFESVTLFFCLNDISVNVTNKTMASHSSPIGFIFEFLKRNSYAYVYTKHLFFDRSKHYFEHDALEYEDPSKIERLELEIKHIKNITSSHNVNLQVVLLPYEFQLRKQANASIFKPQQIVKSILNKHNIAYHDAAVILSAPTSTDLYLKADGIHFSAKGHQILAQWLNSIE